MKLLINRIIDTKQLDREGYARVDYLPNITDIDCQTFINVSIDFKRKLYAIK